MINSELSLENNLTFKNHFVKVNYSRLYIIVNCPFSIFNYLSLGGVTGKTFTINLEPL